MTAPVLIVEDLHISIGGKPVVDGVGFSVSAGEIVTLVGESGCGKSMTAFSVMGLLPRVAARNKGSIRLNGKELAGLDNAAMKRLRGDEMAMIFQEPVASLNPLMPIGKQIAESLIVHRGIRSRRRSGRRSPCWRRSAFPSRPCASISFPSNCRAACARGR